MKKAGTEVIELKGEARKRYQAYFQDTHWKFMVEDLKAPQAKVDQLRKVFFDPSRPVGQFGPSK
jgi:hypothetical protein